MTTRVLWAIAACASLLASAGCGEVDNCREGENGCLRGRVLASGECRYDLIPDRVTGVCVSPDDDDDDDPTPAAPNPCGCAPDEVCQADGTTCVGICEIPGGPVGQKAQLPLCRDSSYTYVQAAEAWCRHACSRFAILCGEPCDPEQACGSVAASAALAQADPACTPALGQAECAMKRCEEARDRPCSQWVCGNGMPPNCANVSCSNSCGEAGKIVLDGVCDDGDLSNAISAICPWGSDCGDCGPRRGAPPPQQRKLGEQCIDPFQCGASYTDFRGAPGWCVPLDESVEHCVPDCTVSRRCPDGYECQALQFENDMGQIDELIDRDERVARACFPTECGG